MKAFAVIVRDRGEDRCIALFSQKFRARNFCKHLHKFEPDTNARMIDTDIDGVLYIPFKEYMEKKQ